MQVVFLGRESTAIDPKGRLSMPARFRDRMRDVPARDANRFAIVDWHGEHLRLFPAFVWEQDLQRLNDFLDNAAHSLSLDEEEQLRSFYFGSSIEVTIDNFGRFVLPRELRDACGIQGEVVWDAAGRYVRLLAPERFATSAGDTSRTRAACERYHAQVRLLRSGGGGETP